MRIHVHHGRPHWKGSPGRRRPAPRHLSRTAGRTVAACWAAPSALSKYARKNSSAASCARTLASAPIFLKKGLRAGRALQTPAGLRGGGGWASPSTGRTPVRHFRSALPGAQPRGLGWPVPGVGSARSRQFLCRRLLQLFFLKKPSSDALISKPVTLPREGYTRHSAITRPGLPKGMAIRPPPLGRPTKAPPKNMGRSRKNPKQGSHPEVSKTQK